MIDIRKLKELVRLMVANELTELDLRDSEEQVSLRRASPSAPVTVAIPPGAAPPAPASPVEVAAPPPAASETDDASGLHAVTSPMVGTFYAAASPDADPFVSVGSVVGPDDPVCILEAMKIFNEIKAECSGTIQKILVKNGDAVEFGQTLFLVKTD